MQAGCAGAIVRLDPIARHGAPEAGTGACDARALKRWITLYENYVAKLEPMKANELQDKRFPKEKPGYRAARNKLLRAEMALRKQAEAVAALRRKLFAGGKVREDYVFFTNVRREPMPAAQAPIVVYHIPETRSERIIWLLEELGAPYEAHRLSYRNKDVKKPEFLAINPLGMVPAISAGGVNIRETGAIVEFLLSRTPSSLAVAPGEADYAEYLMWLHSAEATLFQAVANHIMHEDVLPVDERIPEVARLGREAWSDYLRVIEKRLTGREFLAAGRFTAADLLVGHVLRMAKAGGVLPPDSLAEAYFKRLESRRAYQRMMAAGQ